MKDYIVTKHLEHAHSLMREAEITSDLNEGLVAADSGFLIENTALIRLLKIYNSVSPVEFAEIVLRIEIDPALKNAGLVEKKWASDRLARLLKQKAELIRFCKYNA